MRSSLLLLGLGLVLGVAPMSAEPAKTPLFNGKDLDGWIRRGGAAEYRVADGCIVGVSGDARANTFLCTARDYADFELEFEFKVDPDLNSGVQFRSECFDAPREIQVGTNVIKVAANRVHGYQSEIDNDPKKKRYWTAGVYEEGARGWLLPAQGADAQAKKAFTEQGERLIKVDDWNRVRIRAVGDHIETWLNGEKRADVRDGRTPRGFIALQVHSVPKDLFGREVRWRNLVITDLSAK